MEGGISYSQYVCGEFLFLIPAIFNLKSARKLIETIW